MTSINNTLKKMIVAIMLVLVSASWGLMAKAEAASTNNSTPVSKVAAIFEKKAAQEFISGDKTIDFLDTVWIFYKDNTFEQYAKIENKNTLFSLGTYKMVQGSDFYFANEKDSGDIMISRTQKYDYKQGLVPYKTTRRYDLAQMGFHKVFPIE